MAFLGMKGTGEFATDERPKSWREGILYEYPNGVAPLTAILSMMEAEGLDDYHFHWWTKSLPEEFADVTGIYTDVELSSAYTTAALSQGSYLYLKLSEEDAGKFRGGLMVHFVDKSDTSKQGYGKVQQVVKNGASSYLAVELKQDIADSGATGIDYVRIIGTVNPQGGSRPQSQLRKPVKYENKTQIFRDPLSLTRTAMQTRLRTAKQRREARREALELHATRMEKAFYDGIMSETIGDNGQPETTTRGIIPWIRSEATENVDNYVTSSKVSADTTWLSGGKEWLNTMLEIIFRFGDTEKLAIAGSKALKGINDLAESLGTVNLETRQVDYGLQVTTWYHSAGTLHIMSSPLFTQEEIRRNAMMIIEPRKIKFRYLQDTIFKGDVAYDNQESTDSGIDGAEEEFLTEAGLEFHFPNHCGFLEGVGEDKPA